MKKFVIDGVQYKSKEISGFEGYFATLCGHIISAKKHLNRPIILLKGVKGTNGYLSVSIFRNNKQHNFLVHRLIASCFLYKDKNTKEVNHKNFNRLDNSVENLEWVSAKENSNHRMRAKRYSYGENHPFSKLKTRDIINIRQLIKNGMKQKDIALKYDIIQQTVSNINTGNAWKHVKLEEE